MSNNAEYDSLVSQKKSKQREYNACEDRIDECNDKLRRLKAAKASVTELKASFNTNKKTDKKMKKEDRIWTGSTNDTFKNKMDCLIDANNDHYKHSIDYALDEINDEITRIENIKLKEKGLLGRLGASINSLANKIENFFN